MFSYFMLFSLSIPSKRLQHVAHYWRLLGRGSGWRSHLSSKVEVLTISICQTTTLKKRTPYYKAATPENYLSMQFSPYFCWGCWPCRM